MTRETRDTILYGIVGVGASIIIGAYLYLATIILKDW